MISQKLLRQEFLISFEIFPPKTPAGEQTLKEELAQLALMRPAFVSVTYGAGGSTQEKTLELALSLRKVHGIEPLVHFTCVGAGREEIREYILEVKNQGLENILALRGDPPAGQETFVPPPDGFAHADELVTFIRSITSFTIAVAGYPEGHIEAPDLDTDIDNLKKKVDAGANLIITQLFYNNEDFFRFMEKIRKRGITVPVIPGIMPVTNLTQIKKITSLCGATIPRPLLRDLQECPSEASVCQAGVEYSIRQCRELKKWGVPGFHFYTMNRAGTVKKIIDSI